MSQSYYDTSYPPSLWAPPAPPPAPTLAAINPATGATGATNVTITCTGTGFTPTGTVVKWGATSLPTTYVSATQVTAVMASLPAAGTYQVSVTNANGTSGSRTFTVT